MRYEFDDFVLDTGRVELRRGSKLVDVEPQVFDLLVHLIANRDKVVSSEELFDAVWAGRIVSLSTLTSRINAARKAIGDSGARQKLIKTIPRRGYRFTAEVITASDEAETAPEPESALRQEISFCTSGNNVRIAYAKVGSGPPLVKAGNWLNHLEYDWESPVWSHLLKWMAGGHQLIRYDARGNGLSDWDVQDISFDAFVRDLESGGRCGGARAFRAVRHVAGLRRRHRLCGQASGAGQQADSLRRLCARSAHARHRRDVTQQAEAMLTLMRTGWGQDNPAFRQMFTSLFVPGGTPEQMDWFNELQRNTTSPENAVRIGCVSDYMDVADAAAAGEGADAGSALR